MRAPPDPVAAVRGRRDAALGRIVAAVPFAAFLGLRFERRGDELTAVMPFDERLIGNPRLPAIHGGATAGFLECAAIVGLAFWLGWEGVEAGGPAPEDPLRLPRTIDLTVDYLRPGLPRDAYARAQVNRSGRRFASVHVEAWQDHRGRPFAQGTGHFLVPEDAPGDAPDGGPEAG